MTWYRPPPHEFGLSWGMRGFRIGRSQYGTWWVSLQLPFGFRITRRLGPLKDPRPNLASADLFAGGAHPPLSHSTDAPLKDPSVISRNREILERMKGKRP